MASSIIIQCLHWFVTGKLVKYVSANLRNKHIANFFDLSLESFDRLIKYFPWSRSLKDPFAFSSIPSSSISVSLLIKWSTLEPFCPSIISMTRGKEGNSWVSKSICRLFSIRMLFSWKLCLIASLKILFSVCLSSKPQP